jgi:tetratricopeptide (TPR) repeat protein
MDAARIRTQLETYVKTSYAAEALSDIETPVSSDMDRPFHMRLEAKNARIGNTDRSEAVVAIPQYLLISSLSDFADAFDPDSHLKAGGAKEFLIPYPFVSEWRYHVTPPPGFAARPLPAAQTRRLGPATFTTSFELARDGSVNGTLRFDTGKRRLTLAEANDFRKGFSELSDADPIEISFEQIGESHLAAGRVREALEEFRKLEAMHPSEALHHGQIARALLAAGVGGGARQEAERGVKLEPSSAAAHQEFGWVLQHDLAGRRFKKGSDMKAAEAEYRKAKELDPKDFTIAADLAILLEHNNKGERYGGRQARRGDCGIPVRSRIPRQDHRRR